VLGEVNTNEHYCSKLAQTPSLIATTNGVLEALARCLELGNPDGWADFAGILATLLPRQARAGIAYAALRSLGDDTAYQVASYALFSTFKEGTKQ